MERKTDAIRAILIVFVIGLAISGFTTMKTADDSILSSSAVSDISTNNRVSER